MVDTFTLNPSSKLFLFSGQFTTQIKTSENIGNNQQQDIAYDGTNVPWVADSFPDKLMLTSGVFTSTIKDSEDISGINIQPKGISTSGDDTPWSGNVAADGKMYLQSGRFTPTLKTSQDTIPFGQPLGISFDGTNTPLAMHTGRLVLTSGQFTTTIKSSVLISAIDTSPRGISWDGTNTPWIGIQADKFYLQSGQFTATLKTSGFTFESNPPGIEVSEGRLLSITVTGTIVPTVVETAIVAGGLTIILTVDADTWVPTLGADNAITQALIDGLDSDGSQADGWNARVRDALTFDAVVRVSTAVVTITLPAFVTYDISITETITVTVPASALVVEVSDFVASPTFSVTPTPPAPAPSGGTIRTLYKESQFLTYISPDGIEYPLNTPHTPGRFVLTESGWGTPPIDYITQRSPFQDGVTVKDFFLTPRVIQLLIRQNFCDADGLWDGRAALLDSIRPNRQTTATGTVPGTLRRELVDGSVRDLSVFIAEGPRFEPRTLGVWDEFSFQEVLRFIAYDPVIFDPTRNDILFPIGGLPSDLVFPIDFPIEFGDGLIDDSLSINYVGTWQSFPTILITGPIKNPRIDNLTTGEKLEFTTTISPGQIVTIDLSFGAKTVTDDSGNNLIGTLSTDSDLQTFHIAADPEAPLGVNSMRLQGSEATGATVVEIRYFDRYFGI